MNGALVSGQPIRVGAVSTPTLNVTGSTASEITSGITLAKYASDPLTLNVADVTGNPDSDLTISGTIRDFSAVTGGMTLLKAGTGTLVLSAPNTFTGAVVVAQGTLQLADGNALNSANNCELAGGRLEVDAYAHKLGYLKVTGNNVVSLGTGTLSFANSSDQIWSGELMIEGELAERSIRFGTDQTGLTDLQLAMISDSLGKTVRINKDGYLTGNPLGSVMLVR
jgi:autotransporter-associated beta strand protein